MRTSRKNDMVFKVSAPHIISLLLWSWGGGVGILISAFLCAWNLYQCSLNPQELYNINFKGNWTLISSDGPKLSKQTIKGGVFIWNLYAILRLAQIKTPPPGAFHEVPLYTISKDQPVTYLVFGEGWLVLEAARYFIPRSCINCNQNNYMIVISSKIHNN